MSQSETAGSSGGNEFVKKLFQMLEGAQYNDIVRWLRDGTLFVILDTNEFTKEILPKHFKHLNFLLFVRQLNKYDFHKVKANAKERGPREYGDDAWEFSHRDFRINDRHALENIRRKGPTPKKPSGIDGENGPLLENLNNDVKHLLDDQKRLSSDLATLNQRFNQSLDTVVQLANTVGRYQHAMGVLVELLVAHGVEIPLLDLPSLPLVKRENPSPHLLTQLLLSMSQLQPIPPYLPAYPAYDPPSRPPGLQFHVLLVEDDRVLITLCSKFLEKYGCTVAVVNDGLAAIALAEKVKFDLVLMDIVMPNLDGATALSVIRGFDRDTPIIAMTGNTDSNDLMMYLDHGMSDILAKPFTSMDLYMILNKYLKGEDEHGGEKRQRVE